MNVRKQRDAEIDHIPAQSGGFFCAPQCNSQCGGRRHGSGGREIGWPIIAQDFPCIFSGIEACDAVQNGQPDIVPEHDQDDNQQEDRQLPGDCPLVG